MTGPDEPTPFDELAMLRDLDALTAERDEFTISGLNLPRPVKLQRARGYAASFAREAELWQHVVDTRPRYDLLARAAVRAMSAAREQSRGWSEIADTFEPADDDTDDVEDARLTHAA